MLAGSSHGHKVNFCKFTNETRNGIEDASSNSGQVWIAAVNGTAAGGGYELALACDEILLIDDRSSAVSLPEVPLLAVLPGTGGLTRVVDKRHVRRDLADVFATRTEGDQGSAGSRLGVGRRRRTEDRLRGARDRPSPRSGGSIRSAGACRGHHVAAAREHDGERRGEHRTRHRRGPHRRPRPIRSGAGDRRRAASPAAPPHGCSAAARELDHAILHLRFNEPDDRHVDPHDRGGPDAVWRPSSCSRVSLSIGCAREVRLYLGPHAQATRRFGAHARGARSSPAVASREHSPNSRSPPTAPHVRRGASATTAVAPTIRLTEVNDGWYPDVERALPAAHTRFWGRDDASPWPGTRIGKDLLAADALAAELVTLCAWTTSIGTTRCA